MALVVLCPATQLWCWRVTEKEHERFGDPFTAPFWEGARQGKLLLQYSPSTGRYQFYPRPFLAGTGESDLEWRESSGKGEVYSMTRIFRQMLSGTHVPYICVLVQLDEGVRFLSRMISPDGRIGDRVEVAWEPRGSDPPFPVFRVMRP